MTETMPDVLHAVGMGVAQLRAELALKEQQLNAANSWGSDRSAEVKQVRLDLSNAEVNLGRRKEEVLRLQKAARESYDSYQELLTKHDGLTLALSVLIEDLSGHRDTAKTKSAKIALGHAVEMLRTVYQGEQQS